MNPLVGLRKYVPKVAFYLQARGGLMQKRFKFKSGASDRFLFNGSISDSRHASYGERRKGNGNRRANGPRPSPPAPLSHMFSLGTWVQNHILVLGLADFGTT